MGDFTKKVNIKLTFTFSLKI